MDSEGLDSEGSGGLDFAAVDFCDGVSLSGEGKVLYAENALSECEMRSQNAEMRSQNAKIRSQNAEMRSQNAKICFLSYIQMWHPAVASIERTTIIRERAKEWDLSADEVKAVIALLDGVKFFCFLHFSESAN